MINKLPKIFKWLLENLQSDYNSSSEDLAEEFTFLIDEIGIKKAKAWYRWQVIKSIPSCLRHKFNWSFVMIFNYLKIALRSMKRQKINSFINIASLVIGMTCFILILLYVQHELSYDKYHKNANEIYRVYTEISYSNSLETSNTNCTPLPLAPAIENDFPEITNATRLLGKAGVIKYNNQIHYEDLMFLADTEYLKIFSFPLLKGDSETALSDPFSVVMTQETAVKYFDQENPLGKVVQINNNDHKVTGILKSIPKNSHFQFEVLVPFSIYQKTSFGQSHWNNWGSIHGPTYIQLEKGINSADLEAKLPDFFARHAGENAPKNTGYAFRLEPLTSIHLEGKLESELEANSDKKIVTIFSITGLMILLIACFNYINLSTARSEKKAKEVGIRKTVGANRRKLTVQFLLESLIFSVLAFFLSIFCVKFLLPIFGSMVGRELDFSLLMSSKWLLTFLGIVLFVGFVSGSYPSFYLSSFQPTRVIKGIRFEGKNKASFFRNALVVGQFIISVALIVCTLVITKQLSFIQNRNLGYNKEHIVAVTVRDQDLRNNLEPFKNSLTQHAGVLDICYQDRLPYAIRHIGTIYFDGMTEDDRVKSYVSFIDEHYADFYDMKFLAGRNFSKEMSTDIKAALVNESAVKAIGYENPIGKKLEIWGTNYTIIGMLDDFHYLPLHQTIAPLVLGLSEPSFLTQMGFNRGYLTMKVFSENIQNTLAFIEENFKTFSPNYAFEFSFLENRINRMYVEDQRTSKTFSYFSLIAILIACMGLFGIATFAAERRTKEIGIRKTLGASFLRIIFLLTKDLTKWIIISNIIAWPLAYLLMNKWLQNFAYRIDLGINVFLASALVALLIAILTVSYQSIKATTSKPIDSLRYE